jgi:choline dehydrogenase-like flavoprotein
VRDVPAVFRWLPDTFGDGLLGRLTDKEHVVLQVHGLSEITGVGTAAGGIQVSLDADGVPVGRITLRPDDLAGWDAMDGAVDRMLEVIRGEWPLEFWDAEAGRWVDEAVGRRMPFAFHETGTLWMGRDAADSVSDVHGRIHSLSNVYAMGGATFPDRSSWNPFLTMTALAARLVRHLVGSSILARSGAHHEGSVR